MIEGLRLALAGNISYDRLLRHAVTIKLNPSTSYLPSLWESILHYHLGPDLKRNTASILNSCLRFHNKVST